MKYTIQTNRIYSEDENGKLLAEITFPEIDNGVFCINHTFVDNALRGKGIADQLMRLAVEKIKKKTERLTAACSYAKIWLEKNK